MTNKRNILLINLGSPERPDTGSIRKYLRTFLSDPRVMDMPVIIRWLVLYLFILPFRPGVILPKYKKIWDGERFLLVKMGQQLVQALSEKLGPSFQVQMAMRYSEPSIENVLKRFKMSNSSELLVVPLFPQYASATTGSILERVFDTLKSWTVFPRIRVIPHFFDNPGFINAWACIAEPYLAKNPDHILFSFHGLPEKHILKADHSGSHCLSSDNCCTNLDSTNYNCYRAQCFQTARLIAASLGIEEERYSIGFQSRLGRTQWIGPATSELVVKLAEKGVRHLLVCCPSFVADCLETVEEIQHEEQERFLESGGEVLTLVPSLNVERIWVDALRDLIRKELE